MTYNYSYSIARMTYIGEYSKHWKNFITSTCHGRDGNVNKSSAENKSMKTISSCIQNMTKKLNEMERSTDRR